MNLSPAVERNKARGKDEEVHAAKVTRFLAIVLLNLAGKAES